MKSDLRRLVVAAVSVCWLAVGSAQAHQGWFAGADLLFLSPKLNAVGFNNIFYHGSPTAQFADGVTSSDLDFSQRVYLGYEGECLGGFQVRWFNLDQETGYVGNGVDSSNGIIPIAGNLNLDIDYVDVELTQRGNFRVWDWQATAGVRYAKVDIHESFSDEFEWESFDDAQWFGLAGVTFEGAGPTVSVKGSREVIWEGFSIFGSARTAILFGETELDSIYRNGGGPLVIPDDTAQVWEVQFGVQHVHEFESVDLVSGIFWEAQRWDSDSDLLGGFALHGFGVQTGIQY